MCVCDCLIIIYADVRIIKMIFTKNYLKDIFIIFGGVGEGEAACIMWDGILVP